MTLNKTARALLAAAALSLAAAGAWAQDKVVYHIDDAATQATKGLRNIRNHLDVEPKTQIMVVTHADGGSAAGERTSSGPSASRSNRAVA